MLGQVPCNITYNNNIYNNNKLMLMMEMEIFDFTINDVNVDNHCDRDNNSLTSSGIELIKIIKYYICVIHNEYEDGTIIVVIATIVPSLLWLFMSVELLSINPFCNQLNSLLLLLLVVVVVYYLSQ